MKIRFIKEYVAVDPATNSGIIHRFGETEEIKDYTAQWLIDNGFAEEVKESGWWKPKFDEKYYFSNNFGELGVAPWSNDELDKARYSMGNVFKTKEAAERYRDYLRAVATVRQDEGVLTPEEVMRTAGGGNIIGEIVVNHGGWNLKACMLNTLAMLPSVGVIYFDTYQYAQASLDKHPDEWKTIANYDWSRE